MLRHEQNLVKRRLKRVKTEPTYIPRPNMGAEQLQPEVSHLTIPIWMSRNMQNIILIRSNKMQQYAGIHLLQNYSTCFGCPSHQSPGVHKTVTTASGTGHGIRVTTFLQRGLIRTRWRKVVALTLWPVPEAVVTVLCTPDDRCEGHPKHVE